jgi:hypothetical protein
MSTIASAAAPLACIAATRTGAARWRKDARLAAVLAESGYRTSIVHGDDELSLDDDAELVVCDLVNPAVDLPVQVALAATRGLDVLVLLPAGVPLEGLAADLLARCRATVLRYDGVEPHRVLHRRLFGGAIG